MKYPKIKSIVINSDEYLIEATFDNGDIIIYDMKEKMMDPNYEALKEPSFFKLGKVDVGGYGISWNDEIDLSEYEIWSGGVKKTLV